MEITRAKLAKVDRKKLSRAVRKFNDPTEDSDAQLKEVNKKIGKANMRKLSERVSATKNFVFEFCPEENYPKLTSSDTRTKLPVGRKIPRRNVTRRSTQALPKLHDVPSSTSYNAKTVKLEYSINETLPGIGKAEISKVSPTDRRVDVTKSKWQLLKEERNWHSGKDKIGNARTRKLHEALERIDTNKAMQHLCNEKIPNVYCQREKVDKSKDSRNVSFEDEFTRMREKIYPKCNQGRSGGDASLEELQRRLRREKIMGDNLKTSTLDLMKKSWLDEDKSTKILYHDDGGHSRKEIEKYLEKYDGKGARKEEECDREPEVRQPSSQEVADILARLNIRGNDSYKYVEKKIPNDFEFPRSPENNDSEDIFSIKNVAESRDFGTGIEDENSKFYEIKKSEEDIGAFKDTATEVQEHVSYDGTKRRFSNDSESWLDGSTFLKMGLNGSMDRIPNHFVSQILKSDYLRTEPDLNPM